MKTSDDLIKTNGVIYFIERCEKEIEVLDREIKKLEKKKM